MILCCQSRVRLLLLRLSLQGHTTGAQLPMHLEILGLLHQQCSIKKINRPSITALKLDDFEGDLDLKTQKASEPCNSPLKVTQDAKALLHKDPQDISS